MNKADLLEKQLLSNVGNVNKENIMKKKSVNPAMAMMASRARRMPAARPTVMAPPPVAPSAMPAMPPAMPGMKKGGCATKSDAKMIAKKEVKGHESSMHKMKMGGKCMATGGKASQLSKANGIAIRGKTKGKIC
jgi:hypothetical protein